MQVHALLSSLTQRCQEMGPPHHSSQIGLGCPGWVKFIRKVVECLRESTSFRNQYLLNVLKRKNDWVSSHLWLLALLILGTILTVCFLLLLLFLIIYLFIYLWQCWVFVSVRGLSLVAASGGHSSSRCAGLSLSWPLLLRSTGSRRAGSAIVAHGPSRSAACGIFPDQGSNPCPLHWQAASQPLRHQGSPTVCF